MQGALCLSTGPGTKKGAVSFRLFVQGVYLSGTREGLHPAHLL
jgi:hypothetical protein